MMENVGELKCFSKHLKELLLKMNALVIYEDCPPPRSSQVAMKYLDPAFTSLSSAINEDLKNSSKWKYNSTAFIQLRYRLTHTCTHARTLKT